MRKQKFWRALCVFGLLSWGLSGLAQADQTAGDSGYFSNWFQRVDEAQSSQPHWMTPLITVTPLLMEEYRYDQTTQHLGNGGTLDNYGGGKGLELIPTTTNEIIFNAPPYQVRSHVNPTSGWGDAPFFLVKQRLLSANEAQGNYVVTAFLGVQAPTGSPAFTSNAWVITPTIAAGKGWGNFDVQATLSASIPTTQQDVLGKAITTNAVIQYHLDKIFWPEFEISDTVWSGGLRGGMNQVILTPGVILGRLHLAGRANLSIGAGYQFAVAPSLTKTPVLTPLYDTGWVFTGRVTF
ncbi:putative uncharacterized protein [Burkholderiales bacterium GJ-E10]|nr:putative uncharacterized protein [Burkholderiales bacterium GJ-E10]